MIQDIELRWSIDCMGVRVLQWRKLKLEVSSDVGHVLTWTPWQDVPLVKEY